MLLISRPTDVQTAELFWTFEDSSGGVSHDTMRKRAAQFQGGAKVVSTNTGGHVASTGNARGWISLGDFRGKKSKCRPQRGKTARDACV